MKKLPFLFILALFAVGANAQHVLQFNQGLLVTTSQTVQSGHIWKITGVIYSSSLPNMACPNSGCTASNLDDKIDIGGTPTTVRSFRSGAFYSSTVGSLSMSGGSTWKLDFPIWLPAGTALSTDAGVSGISVLDFIIN